MSKRKVVTKKGWGQLDTAALEAEAMRPPREGLVRNKGWYEAAEFLRGIAFLWGAK